MELNTIYNKDCLIGMKDIPDKSVDMILCDLPYGTTACKWDVIIPFDKLWEQYERVIKDNGAIVLTASQPFTTDLINSNRKYFKYEWIWSKNTATGGALSSYRPMKSHENILVFALNKSIYNPQMINFTEVEMKKMRKHDFVCPSPAVGGGKNISKGWYEGKKKFPKSVISINGVTPVSKEKQEGKHPTQKPVALFEYLIKTYTNEGETILDNCAGSGTTAIACINTNRNYILMEKEKKYFDIINERINNHVAQQKLF